MCEIRLPINEKPPMVFFLHHAYPLAIILANENENFLYSNFIQLRKSNKNDYFFDIYPKISISHMSETDNPIDTQILTGDIVPINENDFIDWLIYWINKGYYVQIDADESKIKGTYNYRMSNFFLHSQLLYGYNLENKSFRILNFDKIKNFVGIDVDFDVVKQALFSKELQENYKEINRNGCYVMLHKLKAKTLQNIYTLDNTLLKIRKNLIDFVECRHTICDRESDEIIDMNLKWGLDTYFYIEQYLVGNYESEYALQCFCGLLEHKLLMKERLIFLRNHGFNIDKKMYMEIQEIVEAAAVLRNFYIKSLYKDNRKLMESKYDKIIKIKETEKRLYEKILDLY